MRRLPYYWAKVPRAIRKPLVFAAGSAIVAAGLALLVLPGPGWVAIFLGFAILAALVLHSAWLRSLYLSRERGYLVVKS